MDWAKQVYHNTRYRYESMRNLAALQNKRVWLMGREYDLADSKQAGQFQAEYKKIVWFSYRNGIQSSDFSSDVGWGCMIRVCQMMLAEAHKRYLYGNPHADRSRRGLMNIISAFLQQPIEGHLRPFCIQNFIGYARLLLNKGTNQFYTPENVCLIAERVILENRAHGYNNVRFQAFSNTVYIDRLLWQLTGSEANCRCPDRRPICKKCMNPRNFVIVSLSLLTNLGKLNEESFSRVAALMKLPISLGALGGFNKRAIYLVGCKENKFFYFDPHHCKMVLKTYDLAQKISEFFCDQVREIIYDRLQASISLCFLIKDLTDLQQLCDIAANQRKPRVIFLQEHTPVEISSDYIVESDMITRQQAKSCTPQLLRRQSVCRLKSLDQMPDEQQSFSWDMVQQEICFKKK